MKAYAQSGSIDTPRNRPFIGLGEHIAGLADFLVWVSRGENGPWCRPEDVKVGKSLWESSAFLNASGSGLRQLLVVDSWTEERQLATMHSWQVQGEMAAYGVPMTLLVAVIGKRRDGRWINPFTRGYRHPVSYELRLQKRDGEPFGPTWEKVWREKYDGTREEWLDGLTYDGVLAESLIVHPIQSLPFDQEIRTVLEAKTLRIQASHELPEVQLSVCDDALHPCPYRSACPYFRLPSERSGFRLLPE